MRVFLKWELTVLMRTISVVEVLDTAKWKKILSHPVT